MSYCPDCAELIREVRELKELLALCEPEIRQSAFELRTRWPSKAREVSFLAGRIAARVGVQE